MMHDRCAAAHNIRAIFLKLEFAFGEFRIFPRRDIGRLCTAVAVSGDGQRSCCLLKQDLYDIYLQCCLPVCRRTHVQPEQHSS